jgi:hypothetical protein
LGQAFEPGPFLVVFQLLRFFWAPFAEEPVQQFGCIRCEQAFFDADAMIQKLGICQAEFAAHSSEAEIPGSEHKPFDTGKHNSARAHDAGLHSHKKGAARQAIILQMGRRLPQRVYFGV